MVKSRDVAKENYLTGIQALGGPSTWFECGKRAETGPAIEVAKCLQEAKRRSATAEEWANKWAKRMYG